MVTDERGRRRFHGAFTGGYSAGYFNTVGSKEGWTPSTFKSSRSSKAAASASSNGSGSVGGGSGGGGQKRRVQTVEDFMDDEDRSDIGFAPKHVTATNDFALVEKKPAPVAPDGFLAGAVLSELVISTENSVGKRLLQRMGWREGQGIGPRMSSRPRNKAEKQSRWGDEHADGKTFAPEDVSIDSFAAKDNLHGIGYERVRACLFLPSVFFVLFLFLFLKRSIGWTLLSASSLTSTSQRTLTTVCNYVDACAMTTTC